MLKNWRKNILRKAFAAAAVFTLAVGSYGVFVEPFQLRNTDYQLQTEKWPGDTAPIRALLIADPHVGSYSVDIDRLDKIVERANEMDPDIILLLGDYLNTPTILSDVVSAEDIADSLGTLQAPYGVYAVLGNHDWVNDGQGMWDALEENGIDVLENEATHILVDPHANRGFWVAGAADESTRRPDLKKVFTAVTNDDPLILIMHDPGTLLQGADRAAVSFAGHMHGGQINIPLIGAPLNPSPTAPREFMYGHIKHDGNDLIVSGGIGTSNLPIRINAVPELVEVTISAKVPKP